MKEYDGERADLALSLDVIYHLVEDGIYEAYMSRLFGSSDRYVIIYYSNTDMQEEGQSPHIRHREFTGWVDEHSKEWELVETIRNKYAGEYEEGPLPDFSYVQI